MEEKHAQFMQAALHEAQQAATIGEIPIGCVIVKDDQIIGRGFNYREHSNLATDHAEIRAIQMANQALRSWRLEDCTLYVTLEPCPMCTGAILNARIPEVYYAAADEKAGMAGTLDNLLNDPRLNHQAIIHKGLLQEQSLKLLKSFFAQARKKS